MRILFALSLAMICGLFLGREVGAMDYDDFGVAAVQGRIFLTVG